MASSIIIKDLNGRKLAVVKGADQTWSQVVQQARLPDRYPYCEKHWMSGDGVETDKERFVKAYLDRIGYILIQDAPDDGILTDYKNMRNRVAEIPASACAEVENILYGVTRPADEGFSFGEQACTDEGAGGTNSKKAQKVLDSLNRGGKTVSKEIGMRQERRRRINAMKKAHPNAKVVFCRVDTSNEFLYAGQRYLLDAAVEGYQPKVLKDGDVYYEMDTIIVVDTADGVFFCDQQGYEIGMDLVRKL